MPFVHFLVAGRVVTSVELLARCDLVVNTIEPGSHVITTAVTVSASRNAERNAAVNENISDSNTFERMPTRILVKVNSSISRRK